MRWWLGLFVIDRCRKCIPFIYFRFGQFSLPIYDWSTHDVIFHRSAGNTPYFYFRSTHLTSLKVFTLHNHRYIFSHSFKFIRSPNTDFCCWNLRFLRLTLLTAFVTCAVPRGQWLRRLLFLPLTVKNFVYPVTRFPASLYVHDVECSDW